MMASATFAQTAEVNVSDLNVRSNPSPTAPIRATLPRGVRGAIINRSGNWVYLVAGRVEGWVYAPYVTIVGSDDGDNGSGSGTNERAVVNAEDVNVRSGPGTSASIRATLPRSTGVTIINRNGDWAYIVAGRVEGWVYSRYLTIVSGDGTGGGTITPGPAPSRYQSNGGITNARYRGTGVGEVEIVSADRIMVTASARGENTSSFSVTYYAAITNRSPGRISGNVTAFASSQAGNETAPLRGQCEIEVSSDSSFLRSFTCEVSGSDHGRTVFTGQ